MILTSCGQSSLVDDLGSVCLPRLSVNTSLHDTEGTSMDTNTVRLYNVKYGHPSGHCLTAMNKHPDSAYNKLWIEQCFDHTMKTDIILNMTVILVYKKIGVYMRKSGTTQPACSGLTHDMKQALILSKASLSTARFRAGTFCSLCSTCTLMYTSFHMTVASHENAL